MEEEIAGLWQDIRTAAATAQPDWARDMYGCPPAARLTPGRRTEIRQALGMLDAAILGEPGVLQARQRLAPRVRSTPPVTPRTRAVSAALGGASAAAQAVLHHGSAKLRAERGMAALLLAARGGARYASNAPWLFTAAGEHRERLRTDAPAGTMSPRQIAPRDQRTAARSRGPLTGVSPCELAGHLLRTQVWSDPAMLPAPAARSPWPRRPRACRRSLSELVKVLCAAARSRSALCSSIRRG
jgi:hypothetical protein